MKKILLFLFITAISSVVTLSQDDYKKGEFFIGYSRNQVDSGIEPGDIPGDPIDKREGFNGVEASAVYNFNRYVGIKGDVSGTFRNDTFTTIVTPNDTTIAAVDIKTRRSVYNVLGGIQIKDNSTETKIKPFAHALVGIGFNRIKTDATDCTSGTTGLCGLNIPATSETESGFAGAFGGGLDIRLNNRIDLRAIQVDYNPIRLDGATQNNIRFSIGLVFK